MAEGILLDFYAPLYYVAEWNMSMEQQCEPAGAFPFWSPEVYTPIIPPGDIGEWWVEEEEKYHKKFIGAQAGECFSGEIDSGFDTEREILKDQKPPKDYKDGLYSIQTFGNVIGAFTGECFLGDISSGPAFKENINPDQPDEKDYYDGIYATQTFSKFVGVFSDDVFSAEITSGVEPIPENQKPETPYPDYKDPEWVEEDDDLPPYGQLYIGAKTNEIYSKEDVSAPSSIDEINKNQNPELDYTDGLYASQTFGKLCHSISGEINAQDTILSGCKTKDEEQNEQDYEDGIYATQTFGKFVGVFSNDVFSFEVVSGGEPIPQNQKPETPYPDYKDPDWVEEEDPPPYGTLFIGAQSNEIYSKDDRSAPVDIKNINKNQKPEEPFIKGVYATQTFGQLIGVVSNEVYSDEISSGVINYHEINSNQPEEKDYYNGIYATQTFSKFVGVFLDDVSSGEIVSGGEPINYNQVPETPYPDYEDPDWVVEEIIPPEKLKETLYIGAVSKEINSNDDVSASYKAVDINKEQNLPKDYEDGLYASQTFGEISFIYSGEDFVSTVASGCKTKDDQQIKWSYYDGIYATQTFGKYIGTFSNDIFSIETVSGIEPAPDNQKPETPYPNYKDPDWVVEEEEVEESNELLIGFRAKDLFFDEEVSAPISVDTINKHQSPNKDFVNGIYATQEFGEISFVYAGEDFVYSNNLSGCKSKDEPQIIIEYIDGLYSSQTFGKLCHSVAGETNAQDTVLSGYKTKDEEQNEQDYYNGIYTTQTFGKFIGVFSDDVSSNEIASSGEPINYGQSPETPYPDYKDPEWVVEEDPPSYGMLFIGAQSNEIYSKDDQSAPIDVKNINKDQKPEEPFIKGIYTTQTFGKLIGAFADDICSNDIESGIEPPPINQKEEIPYPEYKDPEWIFDEEIVTTDELLIGLRALEVYSDDVVSTPIDIDSINEKQEKSKDFIDGIYATQTFGLANFSYSGDSFIYANIVSGCKTENDKQITMEYKDGVYSIQTFGFDTISYSNDAFSIKLISENSTINKNQKEYKYSDGIYSTQLFGLITNLNANDDYSGTIHSGIYPININQPEEKEYLGDLETEWFVEEVVKINTDELLIGARALEINSNDIVSAPEKEENINANQKKLKEYKNGTSSIQTFGYMTDSYSNSIFFSE